MSASPAPKATRREWIGLAVIALPCLLYSMDLTVLNLVFTLTNDLIIGAAPPQSAGAAAGISETASELGGALGIALLGSLATAVYGSAFARETLPQALGLTAAICAAVVMAMAAVIVGVLRPAKAAT